MHENRSSMHNREEITREVDAKKRSLPLDKQKNQTNKNEPLVLMAYDRELSW